MLLLLLVFQKEEQHTCGCVISCRGINIKPENDFSYKNKAFQKHKSNVIEEEEKMQRWNYIFYVETSGTNNMRF